MRVDEISHGNSCSRLTLKRIHSINAIMYFAERNKIHNIRLEKAKVSGYQSP